VSVEPRPTPAALQRLVREIQSGIVDPRTLRPEARRAVVAFLAEGKTKEGKLLTRTALATLLRTTTGRIAKDLAAIRRTAGARLVKTWGVEGAIGFLEQTAEECYAEARAAGDYGMAWAIRSSFVKQLKELGALGGNREQEGFKVTFESVGGGLARLTQQLEQAFRPELTGERVVDARALPLPETLAGAPPPPPEGESFEVPQNSGEEGETNPGVEDPDGGETDPVKGRGRHTPADASGDPPT